MSGRPARSRRWRLARDALRLVWPITGGYRLLVPDLLERVSPRVRGLAALHRRRVVHRTVLTAVVGSLGKTTTARAVAIALDTTPPPQAGNYGALLARTLLRVPPWRRDAVVEVGIAAPGQMAPLAAMVAPDIVVVTSIRGDHHRSFDSMEHKRDEKAAMVRSLGSDGVAVLNGDDANVRWMATQTTARVVTFGLGTDNDVCATVHTDATDAHIVVAIDLDGTSRTVRTRLLGRDTASAVVAALTVAWVRGVDLDDAVRRLESMDPPPGRLERVELGSGVSIIDDAFKSGFETIVSALDSFATVPATRRVVLLGNIEDPEGSPRPLYRSLGERLAASADRVVLVGSDGLTSVVAGAADAGMARTSFTHVGSSIHDAIALLRKELVPGDVLLIKGSSTQRLERVALALSGAHVRCPAKVCKLPLRVRCADCPLLDHEEDAFDNLLLRRRVRV